MINENLKKWAVPCVMNPNPMSAKEALQLLFDVIDGKDIPYSEIKRAKEILKEHFKEE